jgi:plasmid maintenance system antidote protein VapI
MPKKKRAYRSLSDWLDRTGTNQQTLARRAGVTDSVISDLLRGSRRCSLGTALKLNELTGVPVEKLVAWPRFQPRQKTASAAQSEESA